MTLEFKCVECQKVCADDGAIVLWIHLKDTGESVSMPICGKTKCLTAIMDRIVKRCQDKPKEIFTTETMSLPVYRKMVENQG